MRYDIKTFMKRFNGKEIIKKMFSKSNRAAELDSKDRESVALYLEAFIGISTFRKKVFYKVLNTNNDRQILN